MSSDNDFWETFKPPCFCPVCTSSSECLQNCENVSSTIQHIASSSLMHCISNAKHTNHPLPLMTAKKTRTQVLELGFPIPCFIITLYILTLSNSGLIWNWTAFHIDHKIEMHVDIILNCDDCCEDNCCDDGCGGFQRVHLFDQGCHVIYFLDRLILMVMRMVRIPVL